MKKKHLRLVLILIGISLILTGLIILVFNISKSSANKKLNEKSKDVFLNSKEGIKNSTSKDIIKDLQEYFKNEEVVGYLECDCADISYPILQAKDNYKYLETNIQGKSSSYGSIFLDCNNTNDFSDYGSVIYGHHMRDGSMFGSLEKALSDGIENKGFTIYTKNEILNYKFISTEVIDPSKVESSMYIVKNIDKLQDLQNLLQGNHVKLADNVEGENYITLLTCHYVGSKTIRFGATGVLKTTESYNSN